MFRIITEGHLYKEHVLLKNGQGLLIKPATKNDIPLVEKFMNSVSRESLRMRFMASISQVSENFIKDLCNGDFKQSACLLAISGEGNKAKITGLGNYIAVGNQRTAEVAFLIGDKFQGLGIGTLLLERLAGLAIANGFVEFEAEVLPDNQPMINVFNSAGFEKHQVWGTDTVHIELPVSGAAGLWERAGLRERIAVANSLLPLVSPHAVAVIGASRRIDSLGNLIFKNITSSNFSGKVYPVNPQAESVNGTKVYSSSKEIPEKIDLAVIAIPAEKVYEAAQDAIESGAKGLVVVSAGFAEAGNKGKKLQNKLVELVRSSGVRLLGPSCLGLINSDTNVNLNASLAPRIMLKGSAGFFSHSAALGLVILNYAREKGIGFSTFISAGNRADVSGNDLLQYWEEDPNTKMAILYLETFGNPRRFVRIARRMIYKKPILCIKSGRSIVGRKATEAKSGLRTGGELEIEALFHQTGIILSPTLEDLFEVAVILTHQPMPRGSRVSIIANSSGMATLFADACEVNSLSIEGPGIMDLGAFTSPENYEKAVEKALSDNNVDSLLVGFACVGDCDTEPVSEAIRKGVNKAFAKTGIEKPVLLCLMGAIGAISLVDESGKKFPAFRFPESAVNALGRVVKYVEFRKKPPGKLLWYKNVKAERARELVVELLSKSSSGEDKVIKLNKKSASDLLDCFGILKSGKLPKASQLIKIKVKPDQLFGPLLEIILEKAHSIFRITPLTDRDLEEIKKQLGSAKSKGVLEILGRVSQMIEELPWLWEVELEVTTLAKPLLISDPIIKIKSGDILRPTY